MESPYWNVAFVLLLPNAQADPLADLTHSATNAEPHQAAIVPGPMLRTLQLHG